MNDRRRWMRSWGAWVCATAVGVTAGCAAPLGPRTVEMPQAQLQQLVERQFPIERRYLELLDVSVATPRVTLHPEVNRLVTEFDVRVSDRIFNVQHHGTITLDFGLRFEPGDNSVRLTDVRIDRFEVDGASALLHQQLDRIGVQLAEQTLNECPIYRLRPKDVEAGQGRGYRPSDIRVTPAGVVITLLPVSRG